MTTPADAARAVRLDSPPASGVERVIRRQSGVSLAEPVPGFYVRSRLQGDHVARQIAAIAKQFAADDWVWGEEKACCGVNGRTADEVIDLYERDYIATWDAVLDDLELVPFSTLQQAADGLGILAAPHVAAERAARARSVDNTTLVRQRRGRRRPGVGGRAQKAITDRLGGCSTSCRPRSKGGHALRGRSSRRTSSRFTALMAGAPGNAPIDQLLVRIGQMQHYLGSLAIDPNVDAARRAAPTPS